MSFDLEVLAWGHPYHFLLCLWCFQVPLHVPFLLSFYSSLGQSFVGKISGGHSLDLIFQWVPYHKDIPRGCICYLGPSGLCWPRVAFKHPLFWLLSSRHQEMLFHISGRMSWKEKHLHPNDSNAYTLCHYWSQRQCLGVQGGFEQCKCVGKRKKQLLIISLRKMCWMNFCLMK